MGISSDKLLQKMQNSTEWLENLAQKHKAEQIFVVAVIGDTTANVSMHEKDSTGVWEEIMTTHGYIGKRGLGKTKEGDKKTPIGVFYFTKAFGIGDNPGCAIEYQKVTEDDWWSGDSNYNYNKMVKLSEYPNLNKENSEHIIEYTHQYQYCLSISYNEEGKEGLGSAIFLHCLGLDKTYTEGCVAIPKEKMLIVMQNAKKDCQIIIDSIENLTNKYGKAVYR